MYVNTQGLENHEVRYNGTSDS